MPDNFELDKIIGFFEADVLNHSTQAIPTSMSWMQTILRGFSKQQEAYFYQLEVVRKTRRIYQHSFWISQQKRRNVMRC